MQRSRVFLSVNEPILHRLVLNCYDYLLTFSVMQNRLNELILSGRKLRCLKLQNKKKTRTSYINSGNLETTLTPTLNQTRLYFTILYYTILYSLYSDNLNPYTKLDQTLLYYTILYYTILPLFRHLKYLWLCPSFGFSSLLKLSLLL